MRPPASTVLAGILGLTVLGAIALFVTRPASAEAGAPPARAAAPHPLPFAGRLPRPAKPVTRPTRVSIPVSIDGCDHAYGAAGQCVPWRFPKGSRTGCAWLRDHGFRPLAVHGPDRHHLDTNHDGIACGPGDRR